MAKRRYTGFAPGDEEALVGLMRDLTPEISEEIGVAQRKQIRLLYDRTLADARKTQQKPRGGATKYVMPTITILDGGYMIRAGGDTKVTSGGGAASDVLWGTMFGSVKGADGVQNYPQFPKRKKTGHYMWPDIRRLKRNYPPYRELTHEALARGLKNAGPPSSKGKRSRAR